MENSNILSLDLSTTCTGYSVFNVKTKKLCEFGIIKPNLRGGIAKLKYPKQQLAKMQDLSKQILALVQRVSPSVIVIEEIAGSKNRLGQKVLDGFHFITVLYLEQYLEIVHYYDVTGSDGWRTHLQLRLSEADKEANSQARILNKKLTPKHQIPIIGPKHLACRYVNRRFTLSLDVDTVSTDADIADSIAMGAAFLDFRLTELLK